MANTLAAQVSTHGQWFHPEALDPAAETRLFLFPHAGSGAIIYRDWAGLLPPDIGAQAVTLPGRQERRDEAAFTAWDPLVDALYEAVLAECDYRPFAIFGHCLGAQLAYHLAVRMHREGVPEPLLLGMSGWAPEGFFNPTKEHIGMPQEELVDWIKRLGSFPAEIYDNPEMLKMIIPALRADLSVAAQRVDEADPLPCPMVSYGGQDDPLMEERTAFSSWRPRSPHYLGHSEFSGGHFFIDRHALAVISDFTRHLHRIAAAADQPA